MWGNAGCFPRPVQPLLFISYTGSAPIWTNYARRLTQPIAGRTIFLTTLAVEKKNVEHVVDNGEWRTGTRNVMYVYEENSNSRNADRHAKEADRPSDWTGSGRLAGCIPLPDSSQSQ